MTVLLLFLFSLSGPLIEIPGGPFQPGGDGHPAQAPSVTLEPFRIDEFEVTNATFAKVFPAHRYRRGADRHPVSWVTFEEAARFCRKTGGHLPTSAEWQMAARGTDARIYPWGDKAPRKNPQTYYSGMIKRTVGSDRVDKSAYGVRDMAGSVWEWVDDEADGKKMARGGMWNLHLDYEYSRIIDRILVDPDQRFIFLGFRCAYPAN
jgi:formylglycine-generating enzyme required for sulfatase activity